MRHDNNFYCSCIHTVATKMLTPGEETNMLTFGNCSVKGVLKYKAQISEKSPVPVLN